MFGAGKGPFWGCKTGFYLISSQEERLGSPFPPVAAPQGALLGGDREVTWPWPWKEIPASGMGSGMCLCPEKSPWSWKTPKQPRGCSKATTAAPSSLLGDAPGRKSLGSTKLFPVFALQGEKRIPWHGRAREVPAPLIGMLIRDFWGVQELSRDKAAAPCPWFRRHPGPAGCGMGAVGAGWGHPGHPGPGDKGAPGFAHTHPRASNHPVGFSRFLKDFLGLSTHFL